MNSYLDDNLVEQNFDIRSSLTGVVAYCSKCEDMVHPEDFTFDVMCSESCDFDIGFSFVCPVCAHEAKVLMP